MARRAKVKDGKVLFSVQLLKNDYDKLNELSIVEDRSKRDIIRKALELYYKRRMR